MDINKFIGSKIEEFRCKKNISQKELAEFLNTTPQTISRYELGQRKANSDVLFDLAKYFKVSINDFFPPLNSEKQFNNINKENYYLLNKELKEKGILDKEDNITEEDYNKIMDFVDKNIDILISKEKK